jgi:hypothetical protein
MRLFAILLAVALPAGAQEPAHLAQLEATWAASAAGHSIDTAMSLDVDLSDAANLVVVEADGQTQLRYRMAFNNVAEGWSWQPLANPAQDDYYRFKFLPLGTVERESGPRYQQEDMPGRTIEVKQVQRADYFAAFENAYDFYPRARDDDDGFAVVLAPGDATAAALPPANLRMIATLRPTRPATAESTTFWKATDGKPVDYTLKNRYFMATLEEIRFVDRANGRELARIVRRSPSAHKE